MRAAYWNVLEGWGNHDVSRYSSIKTNQDVIVAGGGTAGAVAAIAAARHGARTVLCERQGYVGGMAGTGMFMFGVNDGSGQPAVRGILQEVFDRLESGGWASEHQYDPMFGAISPLDGEMLRSLLLDMLFEAGVELALHTQVVGAAREGDTVRGLTVQTKSEQVLMTADVVVDASGDADVAHYAGAQVTFGRAEDSLTQPASLIFKVGGVDVEEAIGYLRDHPEELRAPNGFTGDDYDPAFLDANPAILLPSFPSLVRAAREAGDWDLLNDRVSLYIIRGRNEVVVNSTRIFGIDGTSSADLTLAEVELNRQARVTLNFLRKYVPGCAGAYLSSVPHHAGVRETRRLVGVHQLEASDVLTGANFSDGVARGAYPLDIHAPAKGARVMGERVGGGDTTLVRIDRSFGIPYRSLVPRQLDGLLVAGRCISATHEAAGAIRGMSICMATGQAAGTAAALASRGHIAPRDLDTAELRDALLLDGAILERADERSS